jgi:GH15 family glucan-1,4-alpha-glucosidase
MTKYFNNAIVGNGKMLACINEKAELLRLYYPNIDYYQNVDTYSIGFVKDSSNETLWLKDSETVNQYYDGNVLFTKLKNSDVEILVKDYVLINSDVLVRKIKCNQPLKTVIISKLNSNKDKLVSRNVYR